MLTENVLDKFRVQILGGAAKMLKATVSAVMLGMGIASGQRVNWSIQVRRYMKPLEGGRGPTMSMCTLSKCASVLCPK